MVYGLRGLPEAGTGFISAASTTFSGSFGENSRTAARSPALGEWRERVRRETPRGGSRITSSGCVRPLQRPSTGSCASSRDAFAGCERAVSSL